MAAFAAFELADHDEALACWLHAAIQRPRAAHMVLDADVDTEPKEFEEVQDHNAGVHLVRSLGKYLKRKPARGFFTAILSAPEVRALMQEHDAALKAWREERGADRTSIDRMLEMRSPACAREQARRLKHLLGT